MTKRKQAKLFDAFDAPAPPGEDALAVAAGDVSTPHIESTYVPNLKPYLNNQPYRIAIIGDYPHRADAYHGKPFMTQGTPDHPYSGAAGMALSMRLSSANIAKDACFLGYVCQYTGVEKEIDKCDFASEQAQKSIEQLTKDLNEFDPHLCVLLGKPALYLAKNEVSIDAWRGTVFVSENPGPFSGRKCLATFAPHKCLAVFSDFALVSFDLRRAATEGKSKTFNPPYRNLVSDTDVFNIIERLHEIKRTKPTIAIDIEGYVDAMSCISISPSPDFSFIVPLGTKAGNNLYETNEIESQVWKALVDVLEDPLIPKVLQNSLYDRFVIQYSYGIIVRGVVDDTMLKHWELYCEFEKSLGFMASIYTNEPYYKQQRKSEDLDLFYKYCCRDSAVTLEISNTLNKYLKPDQLGHYRFNMTLLNPLLYMENRGIRYDYPAAQAALVIVNSHFVVLQSELDTLAGKGVPKFETIPDLLILVQQVMCWKKDTSKIKSDYVEIYPRIRQLLADVYKNNRPLTQVELTDISIECDFSINLRSIKFKEFLYETLSLPTQYKIDKETKEKIVTTDYAALLRLQKIQPTRAVDLAMQIGLLRTRSQMLHISADPDGRVRCGYNIVGTETGRLTCYTSPTGSGYNLQTIPSKDNTKPEGHPLREGMRHLFQADEGYYMFQCDLSGADGWTVAAHCANLGDRTLLDDYLAGIKPAKVLCYLLRHGANSLAGRSRGEIKDLTKEVTSDDWDYFACKCGQHGSCYLMGPQALADLIFMLSEGKISMSVKDSKDLQQLFFFRYRVKLWHEWMERKLKTDPSITTINGYKRKFYGRPKEILGQALAHEPQAITTYATNLAMYRLWRDPDNRTIRHHNNLAGTNALGRTTLRIEPLHQVHDALVGQFRIEDTAWATNKIKSYFANPLIIAGQKLTIPFEGSYGTSWGKLDKGNI